MFKIIKYTVSIIYILGAMSCFMPTSSESQDSIVISNDKDMVLHDEVIQIIEEEAVGPVLNTRAAKDPVDLGVTITYKAQIKPVNVGGDLVQANNILISGSTAYIAYNTAGETFKGAIQVVDISNEENPIIRTEIKFFDMDINTLELDGSTLLFGGQADPGVYNYRSFIGKIDVSGNTVKSQDIMSSITGLDSYATTGIAKHGSNYYVGVGALDGSLKSLDTSLSVLETFPLDDIRDIKTYLNGVILVAGTTDSTNTTGQVRIYPSNNLSNPTIIDINDFGSDYNKASIEVYNGNKYAFLGLSEAGFKVIDIKDTVGLSEVVYNLDNPTSTLTNLTNTNSATYDANYIFLANGEYGFRVLKVKNNLQGLDDAFAEVKGYFPYENLTEGAQKYSANHIEFKSNHLFVASGIGGVLIYYMPVN